MFLYRFGRLSVHSSKASLDRSDLVKLMMFTVRTSWLYLQCSGKAWLKDGENQSTRSTQSARSAPPPQSNPIKPHPAQSSPIKPNQIQSSQIKPNHTQSTHPNPMKPKQTQPIKQSLLNLRSRLRPPNPLSILPSGFITSGVPSPLFNPKRSPKGWGDCGVNRSRILWRAQ